MASQSDHPGDLSAASSDSKPSVLPVAESAVQDLLEARLAEARAAATAGERDRAAFLYRALTEEGVADPRPYCNLGALALMDQRSSEAVTWLRQALERDPDHARSLLNLGMALQLEGLSEEAVASLQRALALDPQLVEAWNNLGVTLASQERAEEAMEAYRRALELQPDHTQAAVNLALLLANHRNPAAGEAVLRGLGEGAMDGSALFHLGEMLRLQGRTEAALAAYDQCLEQGSADWDLRFGVGLALIDCGQADQALAVLLPLLAMRPEDATPLVAVGWSLQKIGEPHQAMGLFERALQLDPSLALAHNLLGICLTQLGEQGKAIGHFRAGLREDPLNAELRCNLSGSLRTQGRLDEAIAEMDALLEQQPDCQVALFTQMFNYSIGSEALAPLSLELGRRYSRMARQESSRLSLSPSQLGQSALPNGVGLPLTILGTPVQAPGDADTWDGPADDRRLRIGFLSAEVGDHVVGSFLCSFLRFYDRDRFAVELFAASRRFDATASRMAERVDHLWLLSGMEIGPARELLRRRRLDVLVETSGFTSDTAIDLLAERCAPIQCHYIGYHATTGLETIDWFLGDAETVPEVFAPQFVERLWRLPRPWLAREPELGLPPARSVHGDGPPVLGSFNQLAKVRHETLHFWAAALRAVPDARLLLKDRSTADGEIRERIEQTLAAEGIDAGKIEYLPHQGTWLEHMACYNRIDLALDATPWSSATTGFDALAMGVPLVAIRGGCTSARMSSGILRGLGRPEWIAETPERYGEIVAALCANLQHLRAGKEALRQELLASPLMDGADLSSALEQAFTAMVAGQASPKT